MSALMDLIAGDAREILLALTVDDHGAFADRSRFAAHLSLGGGLDPTWLDLFAEAARSVTGGSTPGDFLDARHELDDRTMTADRTIERVDPTWIGHVARLPETSLDAIAGHWIDLVEEELGQLQAEEKPWIRQLAAELVTFCRAADRARDVLFAWSL
jgi:hypothetical protein